MSNAGAIISADDDIKITTDGAGAYGAYASERGTLRMGSSADIVTYGGTAFGAYAVTNSSIDIGDYSTIVTSGASAHGAYAYDNSTITIGNFADITTFGNVAHGALAYKSSDITIGDYATITASEEGARAWNNSSMKIGDYATITASQEGVHAWGNSSMTIGDYATITASEEGAHAWDNSSMKIGDYATITASDEGAHAWDNSSMKIGNHATITASWNGVAAYSSADMTIGSHATITASHNGVDAFSSADITIGDYAAITASNNGVDAFSNADITIGHYAVITASNNGVDASSSADITIGDHAAITASRDAAYAYMSADITIGDYAVIIASRNAAYASNSTNITIGDYAAITAWEHGANAYGSSDITIGDYATINTSANGARAWTDSSIEIGDYATINTTGDSANASGNSSIKIGDYAAITTSGSSANGAFASSYSSIDIGIGANISTTGDTAHALYAYDNASIRLSNATTILVAGANAFSVYSQLESRVTGSGVFNITGDMRANGAGGTENTLIDFTLEDGSVFTGKTSYTSDDSVTALNLNLKGSDTLWNVTGGSDLSNLDNAGIVDYTTSAGFSAVTVSNLGDAGFDGGTFIMKSDIVNELADNLIVNGTTSGSYLIDVINDGSQATRGHEITLLVDTADRGGEFALVNDSVDLGAWKYRLRHNVTDYGSGAGWELYGVGELSDPGEAAVQTMMGSYMLAYAETTLIQRMGDLRQSPLLSGVWIRTYGGRSETKTTKNLLRTADMDFWGVNIGYDRKIDIEWSGETYYGVFFGYSEGDMSYSTGGGGNINSMIVGLYGTYIHPNGFYIDSVLKYRWRKSDFGTYDSAGAYVKSNQITTGGFGWSLEMGQRISFNGISKNGWYAEPQVQIRHQRHDEGYYTLSNGLRIGTAGFTSIIGRLGMLIGYETEDRNFYIKVFRAKEFDGDLHVYTNGEPLEEGFKGSWWIYGLGLTMKVSDRNNLYLDLERTSGNDYFDQKWRLNAGWRMEL